MLLKTPHKVNLHKDIIFLDYGSLGILQVMCLYYGNKD